MSLWHQIWFQSLHTGQALLDRHNWSIFGLLGPFWRPQKGNFMSNLIPFVTPNSHKSNLLAPEKIIRWPKVTRSWYMIFVVKHDPFLNHWAHLGTIKRPSYEEISPFGSPQMAEIPYKASKMHCPLGDHPDGASSDIWDQIWLFWAIWWSFQGPKGWICDYWGPQTGSVCS